MPTATMEVSGLPVHPRHSPLRTRSLKASPWSVPLPGELWPSRWLCAVCGGACALTCECLWILPGGTVAGYVAPAGGTVAGVGGPPCARVPVALGLVAPAGEPLQG